MARSAHSATPAEAPRIVQQFATVLTGGRVGSTRVDARDSIASRALDVTSTDEPG
jgi:hypothetical protein